MSKRQKDDASAALRHVAAHWDDARTERTLDGAQRKRTTRRRTTRIAAAAACALCLLALGFGVLGPKHGDSDAAPVAEHAGTRVVNFADGSRALLLDDAARVVVAAVSDTAIDVSLPAGRARFDVAKRPNRAFRVHCDEVVVEVLGTSFELSRDGARTQVRVVHGRVAVRWPGGAIELVAGQSGWFPERTQAAAIVPPPRETTAVQNARATSPKANPQAWRQQAEQGDFSRAYALLDAKRVTDNVEELLLAADAARLSGHAAQAVPFLQRVSERHPDDPRAPLAAFTLGGVLLNQLGRPREADAAYARARELAPQSSLSQDALARQVEAAYRADNAVRARALAHEYLERYPRGRRAQAVRRFGNLP